MKLRALAGCIVLAFACSSQPPPPPPVCCPPTPTPECCMRLGGTQPDGGVCPGLTCDIPAPSTPGWKLSRDVNGCAIWIVPSGPFACGAPPVEAGPPPCAPASVASFVPSPMIPPKAAASACTAQELSDFYDACLTSDMSSAACAALESPDGGDAGTACTACLVSNAADATWGPVVVTTTHAKLNVAGCIALVQNDASTASCAQRASDESQCEAVACDAVCPVSADAGALSYEQCTQEAAAGDCRPYLDAECSMDDAGLSACSGGAGKAAFVALASVFCGGS